MQFRTFCKYVGYLDIQKNNTKLEFYLCRWPSTCSIREKLNSLWTSKVEPVPSTPLPAKKNKKKCSLGMTHIWGMLYSRFPQHLTKVSWIRNSPTVSRAVFILLLLCFEKGEWNTGIVTTRFNSHWAQPPHLQSQSIRGLRKMLCFCRGLLLPPAWQIYLTSASIEFCKLVPNVCQMIW